MAYLGDIVSRLKRQLGTDVVGSYDETLKIDYIQLRAKRQNKDANCKEDGQRGIIYIGGWNLHETPAKGCCVLVCKSQARSLEAAGASREYPVSYGSL